MSEIIARSYHHSCYIPKTKSGDAVVISESLYHKDGTVTPNLRILRNPERTIYVTAPQYRTYKQKKEREKIDHCLVAKCPNNQMFRTALKLLTGKKAPRFMPPGLKDKIMDSPYFYGGSTSIESLIKMDYEKKFKRTGLSMKPPTTGVLDIETSVYEETFDEIVCITVTHENKVYTGVNQKWMKGKTVEDLKQLNQNYIPDALKETFTNLHKQLKDKEYQQLKGNLPFEFHYFIGDEAEMLIWTFQQVQKNKTAFMGIWNLQFDISKILKACGRLGIDPKMLFCYHQLPSDLQYVEFKQDDKRVQHITNKWHWLANSSYTQYIDMMCLYSKIRTVNGYEVSYALDYILQKNGIAGKLKFDLGDLSKLEGSAEWHRRLTRDHFCEYVIYNQWDVMSLQVMEWLTQDLIMMNLLSGYTPIAKYPRETVKNSDTLWAEWIDKGYVIGTCRRGGMHSEYDDCLKAVGGAVLSGRNMRNGGMKLLEENPRLKTLVYAFVSDVDLSQQYPTAMEVCNISKETKVSTVIGFQTQKGFKPDPDGIEQMFCDIITQKSDSYYLGRDFFNLPSFQELKDMYANRS